MVRHNNEIPHQHFKKDWQVRNTAEGVPGCVFAETAGSLAGGGLFPGEEVGGCFQTPGKSV